MSEPLFSGAFDHLAERVGRLLDDPALASTTLRRVSERAPDDQLALAFLLRLGELSVPILRDALRDDARANDLIFCLGASEMIGSGLSLSGPVWIAAFERARSLEAPHDDRDSRARTITATRQLADFKRRAMLEIAIGDVLGRRGVASTIAAMSRLADECIGAALTIAMRETKSEALADHFCVLAMGKLGASELNLSSDIDLIYLLDGPTDLARLEAAQRLGEKLTEILATHCFRIDLRLRPGGRAAPLVSSTEGALGFYEDFGQTWERAALLRARPVAGAIAAGQQFIAALKRFIYRVYLDFDTIRHLRAMKQQIEDELRSSDLVRRNLKLGYGGIRELEFIVQALALIYGGRDPRLRTPQTIAALERLEERGYMSPTRARELAGAYLFMRNAEHKLQVAAGLQTHTIPSEPRALAVLAARLGYGKAPDAARRLMRELDAHRDLVAAQFRAMFKESDEPPDQTVQTIQTVPELAQTAWRVALDPARSTEALVQMGFARPAESVRHLELLARGAAHIPASPMRRAALQRLGPTLLQEIRGLPDPDLALMNLASFVTAVGARTSFLALLEEHVATRRVLLRLFASSAYLSAIFVRHPEMLDTLAGSLPGHARHSPAELAAELHARLDAADDLESRLDALRVFQHQEFLLIAIADLAGGLTFEEVQSRLTILAETVVNAALEYARLETARHTAIAEELRLCVLAMGRLGAREMAYNSDLDLIFVYYLPNEVAAAGREGATRVVQKLIAFLEAPTREGYAYKIDLRLRPSGNAGPLVASLEGFHQYHRQSSALWERQALVRARVVAGDRTLADEVEAARKKFVFGRGLDAPGVREIEAMRARIENELGHESAAQINLKHGPGGLVDVEFLTQMLALRYGQDHPAVRLRGTIHLLDALTQSGMLPAAEARDLEESYRFLAHLENRLRIESDQAANAIPTSPERLAPIARRMGYAGADAAGELLHQVATRRARIREIFRACFVREANLPDPGT